MPKGNYTAWLRAVDQRRLAEIEENIARQLTCIEHLPVGSHDASQAEDLLRVLLQARDALIEQRQLEVLRTAPDDDTPNAPATALDGQTDG